jgi:hypothetical protein
VISSMTLSLQQHAKSIIPPLSKVKGFLKKHNYQIISISYCIFICLNPCLCRPETLPFWGPERGRIIGQPVKMDIFILR